LAEYEGHPNSHGSVIRRRRFFLPPSDVGRVGVFFLPPCLVSKCGLISGRCISHRPVRPILPPHHPPNTSRLLFSSLRDVNCVAGLFFPNPPASTSCSLSVCCALKFARVHFRAVPEELILLSSSPVCMNFRRLVYCISLVARSLRGTSSACLISESLLSYRVFFPPVGTWAVTFFP